MILGRKVDQVGVVLNSQLKKAAESTGSLHSRKNSNVQQFQSDIEIPIVWSNKPVSTTTSKPASRNISRQESLHAFTSPNKKPFVKGDEGDAGKLKRQSSQIINVQQQIIIQQQINNSNQPLQNQAIKDLSKQTKKLKKKVSKKKKKKTSQTETVRSPQTARRVSPKRVLQVSPEREELMNYLLGSSVQKFKQQLREEKLQKELDRQRVTSLQEFKKYMDFQVRNMNQQRFARSQSQLPQLPWGINQQKLKDYWGKMINIHHRLQGQVQSQQLAKERGPQRRQDLGVGFLNKLSESLVEKIKTKQKLVPEKKLQVPPSHSKSNSQTTDRIQGFIQTKQQMWRQRDLQEKQQHLMAEQHKELKLKILQDEINHQKGRQTSISSKRSNEKQLLKEQSGYSVVKSKKKVSGSTKKGSGWTQGSDSDAAQLFFDKASVEQHYAQLHKEYNKLFNWREMESESRKSSQVTPTNPITSTVDNNEFIKWLQSLPESFLEEQLSQMQAINEQMNAQGFTYILSEAEQYQFLEQFLKEKFRRHKEGLKPMSSKPKQQSDPKKTIDERYNQLQQRWLNAAEQFEKKQQSEQVDQNMEQYMEAVQNVAATLIQSVWKGYYIRKIIADYKAYAVECQEQTSEFEFQDEEQAAEDPAISDVFPEGSNQDHNLSFPRSNQSDSSISLPPMIASDSPVEQNYQQFQRKPPTKQFEPLVFDKKESVPLPQSSQSLQGYLKPMVTNQPQYPQEEKVVVAQPQKVQPNIESNPVVVEPPYTMEEHKVPSSKQELKQVLGVIRPPTIKNTPSQVITSGSLVTIQELHSDVKSPQTTMEKVVAPQLMQLKTEQIEKWDQLVQQLSDFKQNGLGGDLQKRALSFIDKLQRQSLLNLQMLSGEELIKQELEKVDQSEEIIREKAMEIGTQTEVAKKVDEGDVMIVPASVKVKSEESRGKDSLDSSDILKGTSDFNISFVFANREAALEQRYQRQFEIMERMLENKKVSIDSFSHNYARLDKRFRREKDKLKAQKGELDRVQQLFRETIKQTQRDHQFIERMKKIEIKEDENISLKQFLSLRSDTEQSEQGEPLHQYNLFNNRREPKPAKLQNQSVSSLDQRSQSFDGPKLSPAEQASGLKEQLTPADLHADYGRGDQELFLTIEDQDDQGLYIDNHIRKKQQPDILVIQTEAQPEEIHAFRGGEQEEQVDFITDTLLYTVIEEFAAELNQFPIASLGVLMEWDEESDRHSDQKAVQGFPTTLNFVKDHLIAFNEFIQNRHLPLFLQTINTPLGISPLELLKTISLSEISGPSLDESQSGPLYPLIKHIHMMEPVIDEEIWEQFCMEQATQGRLKYALTGEQELESMRESEQCHLRMIYEAFNEALNFIRPYGIRGQPYPWLSNPLKVYAHSTNTINYDKAIGFAIAKMLKWGAFLCGFIPEKIETPQGEIILIEEDYLNQIKEDRLQQMLENEIQDSEEKWQAYEEELTEVCVELADVVFETMLDEASEDLMAILLRSR